DVVDIGLLAGGGRGVGVRVDEGRPRRILHRRGASVVLSRHDEHAVTTLGYGPVGARVTDLAATFEPALDQGAGVGTGHHAAQRGVVDRRRGGPRPALPRGHGCRL